MRCGWVRRDEEHENGTKVEMKAGHAGLIAHWRITNLIFFFIIVVEGRPVKSSQAIPSVDKALTNSTPHSLEMTSPRIFLSKFSTQTCFSSPPSSTAQITKYVSPAPWPFDPPLRRRDRPLDRSGPEPARRRGPFLHSPISARKSG